MKQSVYAKLYHGMELACDLVLLNLLWLACCLPVVTIGASTTALHYCVRKMVFDESYTVWGSFFRSFRQNWKQATAVWLLLLLLAAVCCADFYIGSQNQGWIGTACQIVGILAGVAVLGTAVFAFPLLARYDQRVFRLLKNALLLSYTNPHIVLASLAAALLFPALVLLRDSLIIIATPAWILLGGGLPALVSQLLLRPVFAKLEPAAKTEDTHHVNSETETRL